MVITERLAQLRREMAGHGMDGYVVVTDDFHGSEYVGDFFKARAYLSGFTGSAGTLVVLPERDENVVRAARNLADADTTYVNTLNVYDVLNAGKVILTKAALQSVEEVYA